MYDVFYIGLKPNSFENARKVKSVAEAQSLCRTRYFWIVNYLSDYTGFDFLYEPVPWESHQRHVWASQWQQDGGTWLVPKDGYSDTNYHLEIVTRLPNKNIVKIDHGDYDDNSIAFKWKTRYVQSYLDTLIRIVNKWDGEDDNIWVISSICDYSDFSFGWHPGEWEKELLHVFPSNEQKFGDTFYVHVPSARAKLKNVKLLDWYDINFVDSIGAYRKHMPVNMHNADTHVIPVKNHTFTAPVEVFSTAAIPAFHEMTTLNLWAPDTKALTVTSIDSNTIIVPREVQSHIKTQLYDYPYIVKREVELPLGLPVIFVDNGESCAEENYEWAKSILNNKLIRVHGVKGRKNSQLAAANATNSQWYFFVPAKLKINPTFPWNWHPDKLQEPKHYIFHAVNPVTGLIYGHMAAVCYCKNLILSTPGNELDFTMESLHTVVPLISGTATYTADPQMAWRTAFREVIKLKHSLSKQPDIETEYRLECWLEAGEGEVKKYSQLGAQAAIDYYVAVNGSFDALKKTYEWDFLDQLWDETAPHLSLK